MSVLEEICYIGLGYKCYNSKPFVKDYFESAELRITLLIKFCTPQILKESLFSRV